MTATVSTGQLRLLVVLGRASLVAAAAAELGMSRRSLRHTARTFEQQIGVALFVWSRNSVAMTPGGAIFVARAEAVMELLHRTVSRINGNADLLDQLVLPPLPPLPAPEEKALATVDSAP